VIAGCSNEVAVSSAVPASPSIVVAAGLIVALVVANDVLVGTVVGALLSEIFDESNVFVVSAGSMSPAIAVVSILFSTDAVNSSDERSDATVVEMAGSSVDDEICWLCNEVAVLTETTDSSIVVLVSAAMRSSVLATDVVLPSVADVVLAAPPTVASDGSTVAGSVALVVELATPTVKSVAADDAETVADSNDSAVSLPATDDPALAETFAESPARAVSLAAIVEVTEAVRALASIASVESAEVAIVELADVLTLSSTDDAFSALTEAVALED
jgi:hypothetical protein